MPHDFKSLDELLDSADHALFRIIARNHLHVLHPLLPPRIRTVYNLRKLTGNAHTLLYIDLLSNLFVTNTID